MTLKIVNWNVQWATPRSKRSPEIVWSIFARKPDVICLTETHEDLLDDHGGHTILCHRDHGHRIVKGRRKLMLWSAQPWDQVDRIGESSLPPGRFVSGVTSTPIGETTVIGICIPWSGSRTPKFGGTRKHWQDHEEYLDALAQILPRIETPNLMVLGDFNQVIGQRSNVPIRLRDKLQAAFSPDFEIPTASLCHNDKFSIDHLALRSDLSAASLDTISNIGCDGQRLSDHFGVAATLTTQIPTISNHSEE